MNKNEKHEEIVAKLDAASASANIPVRDDTENHVEGPVGSWNTSGTEVAKPTTLERDRYDEQVRNGLPSHGMTPADEVYRRAQKGDETVLGALDDAKAAEAKAAKKNGEDTPVLPVPQTNADRVAQAQDELSS